MNEINRLDFTAAGVISMKMYSFITQCDSFMSQLGFENVDGLCMYSVVC